MMVMDGSPSLERHHSYMYCYAEDGDEDGDGDDDGPRLAGREALSRISACLHCIASHRIASSVCHQVIKSSRCPAIYLLVSTP